MELLATGWDDYEVIDGGDGMRLERIGEVVIARQSAQALWTPQLSKDQWDARVCATHYRPDQGPGSWSYNKRVPDAWPITFGDVTLEMRLTPFGHIGMFAEQQVQWPWLTERMRERADPTALNLFAYTGGSTLACAAGGARVTHLDAVKGIVNWARSNAAASGLGDAPIRWIPDDALKYVRREVRRGRRYDAIVLDPPTFGRGPQGSVWKIERDIVELLSLCEQLLSDEPSLLLLSAHTPGVTAAVLRNLLAPLVAKRGGVLQSGDMVQQTTAAPSIALPAGVYCRWKPASAT